METDILKTLIWRLVEKNNEKKEFWFFITSLRGNDYSYFFELPYNPWSIRSAMSWVDEIKIMKKYYEVREGYTPDEFVKKFGEKYLRRQFSTSTFRRNYLRLLNIPLPQYD